MVTLVAAGPRKKLPLHQESAVSELRAFNWVTQNTGFTATSRGIHSLSIIDKDVVWADAYDGTGGGAYIVEFTRTTNGGTNWTAGKPTGYTSGWGSAMIHATDANTAYFPIYNTTAGGGRIIATTDGGATWTHQTTATYSAPNGFPNVLHFFDKQNGFTMGDPNGGYFEIYTTTNAGTNWVRVASASIPAALSGEYGVVGFYSAVGNTVWFSTNKGRLFKSTDKGLNWTVTDLGIGSVQFKIAFRDANNGMLIITDNDQTMSTTDGGATWTNFTPAAGSFYTNDLTWVPGTEKTLVATGSATGFSGASYSFDGGVNFTDFDAASGVQFLTVRFADANVGWAGSFNSSATVGGMFKYVGQKLPVELTSFSASVVKSSVTLNWETASELNNHGFEIQRKQAGEWLTVGFKSGKGTTSEKNNYSFVDDISALNAGTVSYRLRQIDLDGSFDFSNVVEVEYLASMDFALQQNYPNPFNPSTSISFSLAQSGFVNLSVYDVTGSKVAELINGNMQQGVHTVEFNGSGLSSGLYLYRLTQGELTSTKKLNLLK